MIYKQLFALLTTAIFLTSPTGNAMAETEIFEPGENCVAYKTGKKMFFAVDVEVIGKNCSATFNIDTTSSPSTAIIKAVIPVDKFDSKSIGPRDEHVAEILGGKSLTAMSFTSKPTDRGLLENLANKGESEIEGVLTINGKDNNVTFTAWTDENDGVKFVRAKLVTSFSELGVVVPPAGPGGMMANPGDYLELHLNIQLDKVSGINDLKL